METDTHDRGEKGRTLNLITSVEVEKACEHDSGALLAAIEAAQNQDLSHETVLADPLYGGDDNVQAAKAFGRRRQGETLTSSGVPRGNRSKNQVNL